MKILLIKLPKKNINFFWKYLKVDKQKNSNNFFYKVEWKINKKNQTNVNKKINDFILKTKNNSMKETNWRVFSTNNNIFFFIHMKPMVDDMRNESPIILLLK